MENLDKATLSVYMIVADEDTTNANPIILVANKNGKQYNINLCPETASKLAIRTAAPDAFSQMEGKWLDCAGKCSRPFSLARRKAQ